MTLRIANDYLPVASAAPGCEGNIGGCGDDIARPAAATTLAATKRCILVSSAATTAVVPPAATTAAARTIRTGSSSTSYPSNPQGSRSSRISAINSSATSALGAALSISWAARAGIFSIRIPTIAATQADSATTTATRYHDPLSEVIATLPNIRRSTAGTPDYSCGSPTAVAPTIKPADARDTA